jgi:hypothetical protein
MPSALTHLAAAALVGLFPATMGATRAAAQTYPIDCAILLCLSGGWPASTPCVRARAEFMRRITPWPIEPPLQIWRCPMAASYLGGVVHDPDSQLYDILFNEAPLPPISADPAILDAALIIREWAVSPRHLPPFDDTDLHLAQGADMDISGSAFDFVRSIRLYNVRLAEQYNAGSEGECMRSASVALGAYGTQGAFSWESSSPDALPPAHVGLESWGSECPRVSNRSVFVEWRDFEGNYGFEQIDY